jgi:hypothetical protein
MHSQKVKDIDGSEWHSMHAALCHAPGIAAVHCSKRVFDLGKWNVSTTQDSWDAVKQWLDHQLLPLYHSIPAEVRDNYKTYADFIEPHRLQYNPPQNGRSDISELSDYAQRIQTQMLGNTTAPELHTINLRHGKPNDLSSFGLLMKKTPPRLLHQYAKANMTTFPLA